MTNDLRAPLGYLRRLAADDVTQEELDLLMAWLEVEPEPRPPEPVLRRAENIPRTRRSRPTPQLERWKHLIATLVEDTGPNPVLAGARGTGTARLLVYTVGELEIVLQVSESFDEAPSLTGKISGGQNWREAILATAAGDEVTSDIDGTGMFAFADVPHASTLRLRDLENEVSIALRL